MCGRADVVFYYNQPFSSKESPIAFFFFNVLTVYQTQIH